MMMLVALIDQSRLQFQELVRHLPCHHHVPRCLALEANGSGRHRIAGIRQALSDGKDPD